MLGRLLPRGMLLKNKILCALRQTCLSCSSHAEEHKDLTTGTDSKECDSAAQIREKRAEEFLANMNEILKKKKKIIEADLEEQRLLYQQVPDFISDRDWQILLTECDSKSQRMKHLNYLYRKETKHTRPKKKKSENKQEKTSNEHMVSTQLTYPEHQRIRQGYHCYKSLVLGNPIVFDMDFEATDKEQRGFASQIHECYHKILSHQYPFHIHFTGSKNEHFKDLINKSKIDKKWYASFHGNNSFTDLFETDQLVYLLPDGPYLPDWDGPNIYVIGGLLDNHDRSGRHLDRANALGIRSGRIPLNKYVRLQQNRLPLMSATEVLLELNLSQNWKHAIYNGLSNVRYSPVTDTSKKQNKKFTSRQWNKK